MLLICEGIFFLAGLYALVTGKFKFSNNRMLRGDRARLVGFLLMIPGPAALCMGLVVAANMRSARQLEESVVPLTAIELLLVLGSIIAAAFITYTSPPVTDAAEPQVVGGYAAPNIMTVPEAARYLRVTEQQLLTMIDEGKIPAAKIGPEFRISKGR